MYLELLSVFRYFREYIEAADGALELKKALDWSVWYAAKWWKEIKEAGVARSNAFVKALRESLYFHGVLDERGDIKREVKKPELPKGLYAREWVEMHERLDQIGAVKIANDEADRNALELLYSDIQVQGWHRIMVKAFLKAVKMPRGLALLEPYSKEGHLAALVYEDHTPSLYLGYEPNQSLVEIARYVAPHAKFVAATSACDIGGDFDAALMVEKMQWMPDPAKELECIKKRLREGGVVYVAQPVAESMPGYLAIMAALGAVHVFTWRQVESLLKMHFTPERRLIKTMPFYGAVWKTRPLGPTQPP